MAQQTDIISLLDGIVTIQRAITTMTIDPYVKKLGLKSALDGRDLDTFDAVLAEVEACKAELKEQIKEGTIEVPETEHFMIVSQTSYEYDVAKVKALIPNEAAFFIQTTTSIKKAELDKAIKSGVIKMDPKDALVPKTMSIKFLDKEKEKAKQEKEIAV
jgi:hypothetical protein